MKRFLCVYSVVVLSLFSCSNEKSEVMEEAAKIGAIEGIPANDLMSVGKTIELSVTLVNKGETTYRWETNGTLVSDRSNYLFAPEKAGDYTIRVTATTPKGSDSKQIVLSVVNLPEKKSKWISEVLEYRPAPGQFINTSTGNMEAAHSIVGKRGLVSLGGYGGTIVFRFDHTVINQEGVDFIVLGNAFEGSSEPGIVSVAFDANGNGIADDKWYELKGDAYDQSRKGYTLVYAKPSQEATAEDVAWSDNNGEAGSLKANLFHGQCYFPLFLEGNPSQLQFSGNKNTIDITHNPDLGWALNALGEGYADNYSSDYTTVVDGDNDTKNGNKFDIADAIDENGNSVALKGVDFIKVYTSVNQQTELLGEVSTEVCGAVSLTK